MARKRRDLTNLPDIEAIIAKCASRESQDEAVRTSLAEPVRRRCKLIVTRHESFEFTSEQDLSTPELQQAALVDAIKRHLPSVSLQEAMDAAIDFSLVVHQSDADESPRALVIDSGFVVRWRAQDMGDSQICAATYIHSNEVEG